MTDPWPSRRLKDYRAHPPSPLQRAILVALAVLIPVMLWDKRGAFVGLIAFVVYGGLLLAAAVDAGNARGRSTRRIAVVLDAALIAPLAFLAFAYLTDLSLAVCAVIGLAAGFVVVSVALWRGGPPAP